MSDLCVLETHEIMFFHVSLASVLLDTDVHEQHQGCSLWNSTFTTPECLQDPTGRKRRSNANGSGIVEALFPACPRDSDLRRKHSQRERACSVREPAPCQDFPSLLGEGGEGSEKRSQGRTGLMQSPLFYEHLYYLLLKKS